MTMQVLKAGMGGVYSAANRGKKVDEDAPVIECVNLTHYYGDRLIYKDLSFSVAKGSVVGLLGKNGTGKTTTINILNGYLQPHSGECRLFGQDSQRLSASVQRRVGLLLEGHVQYPFMTVAQAERFFSAFYPCWDSNVYNELTSRLRISPRQRIASMSCGQRSQVVLGLILAQNADLLILDDFTLGLDPGYRRLFIDYLREYVLDRGKTVFVTSHIIQDMERFINECIILDYGKILAQMPTHEILDRCTIYELDCEEESAAEKLLMAKQEVVYHPERRKKRLRFASFLAPLDVRALLSSQGVGSDGLSFRRPDDLEDAFIALTGEY